ncbi:PAS domain-containing protein [Polyangium sp. 15x6]|uniref:PAS domain-containing protein n=1 Tax=Polyangium sp. 15x6 TaxID=3042687 RepID=UPI00249BE0F0|nr:PAS domain-containing protein [Polyangium sp. 15x6]MDI3289373.1 PAS domain-containing protein [Polyangium sp. 15x6]
MNTEAGLLQELADGMPDPMFFKDRQHRWIAFNRAFCDLLGRPAEEIRGRSDPDFFPPDQVTVFWQHDDLVFETGRPDLNEEKITLADGGLRILWTRKVPIRDASRSVVGLYGLIMDITDQMEHARKTEVLEAEAARQQAIIEAQERVIDGLVVPVLEIWEGILLLPLVGALSQSRAAHAIESVLAAVSERGTETVLIDVTGAGLPDASGAEIIARAVRALALLGCRTILVGISAESARTFVEGGLDLGGMTTCATLKQGLSRALALRRKPSAR